MKAALKIAFALAIILTVSLLYAAAKGDAKKGKEIFTTKCGTCHGPAGEVKPAIEKMFSVKMKPLGSKEVQSKSDADLQKNITMENGKMKPVKLTDAEAADVIAFLRTLAAEKK